MNWGHTSASQIKTFRSCRRKWYRESVLGERQPAGPAALRGQAIHAELEDYLEHGTQPKDGTAQALTRMLPEGGTIPANQIEVGFLWQPPEWSAPAKGYVDLCLPPNEIIDHKSTASLNYALTEEQARRDPQALIYSGVALSGALGLDFDDQGVTFRLNYATTRGALKTRSVAVDLVPEEILEGLDQLASSVVNIQAVLAVSDAEWSAVEPNYSACDAYGGCPFRHDCQRAARPVVKEVLTVGSSQNFKETLKRRRAQATSKPKPPIAQSEKAPQKAIHAPSLPSLDEAGGQYVNANPPDGLPDGAPLPESARPKTRAPQYKGRTITTLKAQELRDAVTSVAQELTEAQRLSVSTGAEPKGTKADNQARLIEMLEIKNNPQSESKMSNNRAEQDSLFWSIMDQTETTPPETTAAPVTQQQDVAPPAPVAPPPPTQPAPPKPVNAQEEPPEHPPEWDDHDVKLVLVDAHATGAVELELCLRDLIQEIERRYEMPISVIKYNEGWKELAGHISARGWRNSGLANIVRIDSASPLWSACSHVIVSMAHHVIRGTR